MILKTHSWGSAGQESIVCVHGIAQHGGVFDRLARRLADRDFSVTAVDLRGHGDSERQPPWDTEAHVQDLLDTLDSQQIGSATFIGHSFGGRVAAALAARSADRVQRLVLLDPGLEIPPDRVLRNAEIERLDWSFATVDGAITAVMSNESMVAAPREVVEAYVRSDVGKGPDGRYRFRFCPSAAVVAWNEVALSGPPIAEIPTLFVRSTVSLLDGDVQERRYREALGDLLTFTTVPHGHNVLWEAPLETAAAIEPFLE